MNNTKIDKFIKQYFGDVKTANPKYYERLVEEINSIIDQKMDKKITSNDFFRIHMLATTWDKKKMMSECVTPYQCLALMDKYAKTLKGSWQELEIRVVAQNGIEFEPKIKAVVDDDFKVTHLRITH